MCHWQQLQYITIRMWSEIRNCCYVRRLSPTVQLWINSGTVQRQLFEEVLLPTSLTTQQRPDMKWALQVLRTLVINRERTGERWLWWGRGEGAHHKGRNKDLCTSQVQPSLMRFESCFTSSSVRLVFSTASTWEADKKMYLYQRYVFLLISLCLLIPIENICYFNLIVPARRGLNAYSQSCISLSLVACSNIPRCSVQMANVYGVCWKSQEKKLNIPSMSLADQKEGVFGKSPTFSIACWSSLYSTWAEERLRMARSTESLSAL